MGKLPPGAGKVAPLTRDGQTPALPAPGAGQAATGPPYPLVAEGTFEERDWGKEQRHGRERTPSPGTFLTLFLPLL